MKKTYSLLILGAILEYYDYAIYIYFANSIGSALIPINDKISNLVATFSIFAISALIRPIGGVIFANYGDKKGRRNSFTNTILLMGIPTILIGLIPNQEIIGKWSVLLLLLFRSIQGFAIGGEVPASMVFAYELSTRNRAINTNVVVAGTNIGLFAASLMCLYLLDYKSDFIAPWRIAFIIGGLFGIISYFCRKKLIESPDFMKISNSVTHTPFIELIKHNKSSLIKMIVFACYCASLVAVFSMFMPNYLNSFLKFPLAQTMSLNSFAILIFITSAILAGKFDYLFNKNFLITSLILSNIAFVIIFFNISKIEFELFKIIHIITLCYVGIICGRLPVIICNFFPITVRYSGVALSYNISFGIVLGVSQLLLTSLIKLTSCIQIPMYFILFFSIPYFLFILYSSSEQLNKYQ